MFKGFKLSAPIIYLLAICLLVTTDSFASVLNLNSVQFLESEAILGIAGLLLIGLGLVLVFAWIFGFLRNGKLETENFVFNHSLLTSRMIFTFGGIAYPFLNYLNYVTEEKVIYPQLWFPIILGVLMIALAAGSFKSKLIQRNLPRAVAFFYLLVLFHVSFITIINLMLPLHVIGLCLVISLGSIIIANPFKLLATGLVYLVLIISITYYLPFTNLPKTQLISALFTALLISFLLSLTKRTLNSRLALGSKILNDLHNVILIIDRGGNVQYVNKGAKNLFNIPRRHFLGQGWWSISSLNSSEPEEIFEHVSQFYDNIDQTVTTKEKFGEGQEGFIRWRYQLLDQDWLAMVGENITENFKIEQELQKLSIVAKYSEVAVIISDKDSKVEWVNSKCEEMTGYSLKEFIGRRPAELLAGEQTDTDIVEETRSEESIRGGYRFEVLNYKKNGEKMWISVVNSPIYNEKGEIEQIVEIAQDITEKKLQEEKIKIETQMSRVLNQIDSTLMKFSDWNVAMNDVLLILEKEFPIINKCSFYEFDGEFVLEHSNKLAGLPSLSLKDSQAILGIRNYMFGPKLIYNQNENEPWSRSLQEAMGVSNKSNFIFYQIKEKSRLLGYFAVSSENPEFIEPVIINGFRKFVEHINLRLIEYLGSARLTSLNKKLHHINELSTAVLNGENVGKKIENLLLDIVGDSLVRANTLLYNFENGTAEYYYSFEGQSSTYSGTFDLAKISEMAMKSLSRNQYFAVDDLRKRKNLSDSDIKMLDSGVVSFVMFPLFQNQKLFGSLNISMNKTLSELPQGFGDFLNDLTEELSVSIYQKVLLEQTEKSKQQIQVLHNDIQASVRSAKRIQGSILPDLNLFKELFDESFVFYQPKDVVSGDFYYLQDFGDKIIIAAADCTGHGVPGALVSMVCKSAMDKTILEKKIYNPADILFQTRQEIIEKFDSGDDIYEGMDIALCVIYPNEMRCEFSGAHNPLWILKNETNELVEIAGDKIGVNKLYDGQEFKMHELTYDKGDRFYVFSDGFSDQFGGENFRKFGPQRMRQMISESYYMDSDEQFAYVLNTFNRWKGESDQIDDVCFISFKP